MTLLAYSVAQAIDATPLTRRTIYEAMRSGELAFKKRGRRTFILANDLQRYLESLPSGGR